MSSVLLVPYDYPYRCDNDPENYEYLEHRDNSEQQDIKNDKQLSMFEIQRINCKKHKTKEDYDMLLYYRRRLKEAENFKIIRKLPSKVQIIKKNLK